MSDRFNFRGRYFSAIASLLALGLFSQAYCSEIDWRNYPGSANLPAGISTYDPVGSANPPTLPAGNYITPVLSQGTVETCWAFTAAAAIEANYAITNKIINPTLQLSEQNLVCAGNMPGNYNGISFGNIFGGTEDLATIYCSSTNGGIATASAMPYNGTNTSSNWPLRAPYTLYKITSAVGASDLFFTNAGAINTALEKYGPLEAEIDASADFIYPAGVAGHTAGDYYPANGGSSDLPYHAVLIVGFNDDSSLPSADGGGYYIVKNSWGNTWGPTNNGYGYVPYTAMVNNDWITEITGTSYTVATTPEPSMFALFCAVTIFMTLRRKRPTQSV